MTEPLQPQQSTDAVPIPDAQKSSVEQTGNNEGVEALMKQTTADIHENLTGEQQINTQKTPPIREENLRELREKCRKRKEVEDLSESDGAIIDARGGKDEGAIEKLVSEHIKRTEDVSMLFLKDAEAECAMSAIDLEKTRVLIQLGYSYAKSLSAGRHKNPGALNALKAWQTKVAGQRPEAVRQLVESYQDTIIAETTGEKPDLIMLTQWIDLCTGFAPELATELAEKFQGAIHTRCEYFIAQVEAELAKEKPNMSVIRLNIIVPPNYYTQLAPGSTIPDRVKALEEQFDALTKK